MRNFLTGILYVAAAVASSMPAAAQFDLKKALNEARNRGVNQLAPGTTVAAPPPAVADHALEGTFNVMLGEPPISVARDTRCEIVAPTNPAELMTNLVVNRKDQIADLLRARLDDKATDEQEDSLEDDARLEMKRQVWLPLSIEEAVGERLLAQRTATSTIIPEDDPAASAFYPALKAIFDELAQQAGVLQPYDLRLLVIQDSTGSPNAETLPGGIVLVNFELANSDPERIYAYLSHELGHVTKRHQTMALQAKLIDSVQSVEALRSLTALSNEELLTRVLAVVDLTAAVFTRYYSAQELEADGCGAKYLASSPNLDGAKSISAFLEDIDNAEKTAPEEVPNSRIKLVKQQHPPYAERAQAMQDSYVYWVAQR